MTNAIAYKGSVSVKIKTKPIVKKPNNGTKHLFDFLAHVLTEGPATIFPDYFTEHQPYFIDLIDSASIDLKEGESLLDYFTASYKNMLSASLLLAPAPIKERTISSHAVDSSSITYTSFIPSSLFHVDSVSTCVFVLVDAAQERVLAFAELDSDSSTVLNAIAAGRYGQAEISWSLDIMNANK